MNNNSLMQYHQDAIAETVEPQAIHHKKVTLRFIILRISNNIQQLGSGHSRNFILVWVLLSLFLFTSTFSLGYVASSAYTQYTALKALGTDGAHELLAIKTLVGDAIKTADPSTGIEGKARAVLQPALMNAMQGHAQIALAKFQQIATMIDQHQGVLWIAQISPFASKIDEVDAIAHIGIDASQLAILIAQNATAFAPIFQGSLLANTGGPLLTQQQFTLIQTLLPKIQTYVAEIAHLLPSIHVQDLPLTPSQRQQAASLPQLLKNPLVILSQVRQYFPAIGWLLGIDGERSFLVQTLDRGELRPTGGFTGQFGIVTINGGRVGPIALSDVMTIDKKNDYGQTPAPFNIWWPWGWEMRDASVSGDYPTSAKFIMGEYTAETGHTVDGDIQISPLVIEHLLVTDLLGPLTVPCYNYTVNSTNLEDTLHYFQLGSGVALEAKCAQSSDTTLRKQFTSALSAQLQDRIRKATPQIQSKILQSLLNDMKASNIEAYFSNPDAEKVLAQYNVNSALVVNPAGDETAIVQANIGANKGSVYMNTHTSEQITLDAQGNAHHNLTIAFDYKPTGDVYGVPTIRDYIRVYAPAGAQFVSGSGFDALTSNPYCYGFCQPPNHPICQVTAKNPYGFFIPDPIYVNFPRVMGSVPGYFDAIGGPTNFTSDISNRAMFGGLVELPPFCSTTVTLQWVVPHIAQYSSSHTVAYSFIERRQSGTLDDVTVQVTPPANAGQPQTIHDAVMENNIEVRFGA